MAETVHVEIDGYPGSPIYGASADIEDTPILRAQLEEYAIPKCKEWREANPEPMTHPGDSAAADIEGRPTTMPAPYCCSSYCVRCNGLRALDGEKPLRANEWILPS